MDRVVQFHVSPLLSILRRFWRIWFPLLLLVAAAMAWHWYRERPLRQARSAAAKNRWLEAGSLATSYLLTHPNNRDATVLLARSQAAIGLIEEAEQNFSKVPDLSVQELTWRGDALLRSKWWARATPVYEEIVRAEPENWAAVKYLAALLERENRTDEALALATNATAVPSQAAAAHFLCGLIQIRQGKSQEAVDHFEKVLELDPTAATLPPGNSEMSVRFLLAESHLSLGQADVAKRYLIEILRTEPENSRALSLLGRAHFELGDREAARRCWDRSLAIEPDQCDLKRRVAQFELEQGHTATALEILTELESRCPPTVALHHALGLVHSANGDTEKSKKHFEEANRLRAEQEKREVVDGMIRRYSVRPEAKLIQARREIAAGNYLQAESLLNEVLAEQPNNEIALALLEQSRLQRGRAATAAPSNP
jgi:tetratricopeptide (TPR) repeat protein